MQARREDLVKKAGEQVSDPTSNGAMVTSATTDSTVMGVPAVRKGAICTCPSPGHGVCTILFFLKTHHA